MSEIAVPMFTPMKPSGKGGKNAIQQ